MGDRGNRRNREKSSDFNGKEGVRENFAVSPKLPKAICGVCGHFQNCDASNFGDCAIDATGKGWQVHRMYQSNCDKFAKTKGNRHV